MWIAAWFNLDPSNSNIVQSVGPHSSTCACHVLPEYFEPVPATLPNQPLVDRQINSQLDMLRL